MLGRGEVGFDRGGRFRVRVRLGKCGDLQQLVNRRRLGLGFREAVTLGERGDLMRVDAVDEPIEVFPQSRVGPCSVR